MEGLYPKTGQVGNLRHVPLDQCQGLTAILQTRPYL